MASLRIIGGLNCGQSFLLDDVENLIGRETWCQVRLNSRTVSRKHARIFREADGYFVEDLSSVNGTSVNGRRIDRRMRLEDGDQLQIYDTVLQFQLDDGHAAKVSPAAAHDHTDDLGNGSSASPDTTSDFRNEIVSQVDIHEQHHEIHTTDSEQKLAAILQIARSIGTSLSVDEIVTRMLDTLFDLFPNARTGYVLQATAVGSGLAPNAVKSRGDAADTVSPIGLKIAQRVMIEGLAFLTATKQREADPEPGSSIFDDEVRSIMCAPLIGPSRTAMGVIELVSVDPRAPFTPNDLEVLSIVAILAGQAVENARLHQSLLELDGRRREIALARGLQLHFLPKAPPASDDYRFFHHYAAADTVAGDYFDYIPLPDGRWAIALGDVSGKGVSAALMMARLYSDVRFCLLTSSSLAEAVTKLNQQVFEHSLGDAFVSMLLFLLDPVAHQITIVDAGHPLPLRRRNGGTAEPMIEIDDVGFPLGILPDVEYSQRSLSVLPGDLVLAYTDGVSEANDDEGRLYGVETVQEVFNGTSPVPAHSVRALLMHLRDFVNGTPQSDDICIVSFGRCPAS